MPTTLHAPLDLAAVVDRFNDVFQRHDPTALTELVGADCVLENSQPAPNGSRHVGKAACVAMWTDIATDPRIWFDVEEVTIADERAVIFWRLHWGEGEGCSVRGVNLMRVVDGKIVEARGYVKGAA